MVRSAAVVLSLVLVCAVPALADTTQVFNVNATFLDFNGGDVYGGGSLTGTETIDLTTGTILGASLTSTNQGATYFFKGAPVSQGLDYGTSYAGDPLPNAYDAKFVSGAATLDLNLSLNTTSYGYYPDLTTYAGGPICSANGDTCSPGGYNDESILSAPVGGTYVYDGDLTPVVTPEPSTLVLLGTGMLGAAGAVRRRLTRA